MLNVVVLVGRLGQDAELKYFESGSVKARFTVAVDRTVGRENKQTDWFTVEAWGKLAEFAGEWLKKGQLVSVTGQLEVRQWTDQTGNTREALSIRAVEIRLEGSRRDNLQAGGSNDFSSGGPGAYSGNPATELSPF